MADILPRALSQAIDSLGSLPGVGSRTAERYAYFLLRAKPQTAQAIARAVTGLHEGVRQCPITFALIDPDQEVSPLYSDPTRDRSLIAVVEEPLDIVAIERTGQYHGTYHVLGGALSPIDGIGPEQLHIPELAERIRRDQVSEVIIATNASVEGESTALFIQRVLAEAKLDVTLSRLARGIPVGVDLEYTDQITLGHALAGRRQL